MSHVQKSARNHSLQVTLTESLIQVACKVSGSWRQLSWTRHHQVVPEPHDLLFTRNFESVMPELEYMVSWDLTCTMGQCRVQFYMSSDQCRSEENKCWLIFIDRLSHSTVNAIVNSVGRPDQWQRSDPLRVGSKHGAVLKFSCLTSKELSRCYVIN